MSTIFFNICFYFLMNNNVKTRYNTKKSKIVLFESEKKNRKKREKEREREGEGEGGRER